MLKKIAISSLAAASLIISTNASALTGAYVNGQLGYVNQTANSSLDTTSLDDQSKKHFGYNLFLGYNYDLDEQFSIAGEIGYGDYGQTEWENSSNSNSLSADQSAFLLLGVGRYRFNPLFSTYLKAGFAFGQTDIDTDGTVVLTDGKTSETFDNTQLMTALGVTYNFTPELATNLEWQHIFGDKITSDAVSRFQTVDAFMLGLTYTFEV